MLFKKIVHLWAYILIGNGIYHVSKNGIDRDTYIQNTLKLSK